LPGCPRRVRPFGLRSRRLRGQGCPRHRLLDDHTRDVKVPPSTAGPGPMASPGRKPSGWRGRRSTMPPRSLSPGCWMSKADGLTQAVVETFGQGRPPLRPRRSLDRRPYHRQPDGRRPDRDPAGQAHRVVLALPLLAVSQSDRRRGPHHAIRRRLGPTDGMVGQPGGVVYPATWTRSSPGTGRRPHEGLRIESRRPRWPSSAASMPKRASPAPPVVHAILGVWVVYFSIGSPASSSEGRSATLARRDGVFGLFLFGSWCPPLPNKL